jgi:2-keto-3-deoxy-L-rhamnonate aldolase RhmA
MNRLRKAVEQNHAQTLLGAALYFYDPVFLEIAAHLGFQVIWIEMEHGHITFAEAADLCRMAAGTGMLTMIRVPDSCRENMLHAAECGPDIIDVPMVNQPAQMEEMLKYARFAPAGQRGYFGVSRAVDYGVGNRVNEMQQGLNQELCLLAQIETAQALQNLDQLAAVPGVDFFVGPADLAASLGFPGQTLHPSVQQAATRIVQAARANGKCVAAACAPSDFKFWLDQRIDLLFCANDIASLKRGAGLALDEARALLPSAREKTA